jgi:hypothetical protein
MAAALQWQPPWFIMFLQSASMVVAFCVTNVLIPTSRRVVKLKWENSHFLGPSASSERQNLDLAK